MNWLRHIVVLGLMACCMGPGFAETPDPYLAKKINTFMQRYQVPGMAVALVIHGKPADYYFGPVVGKTIFEIGDLSEVMTAILVAQEVDWARMQFADPITKYVKDLSKRHDRIRLQDLSTIHTADSGLLEKALENATESSFDDLYRRHILNPLQMANGMTFPSAWDKYYAQGHDEAGKPVPRILSGMKASAIDMQHFLRAAIGLPGTPARVFYPMRMTQSIYVKIGEDYRGLGWMIHPLDKFSAFPETSSRPVFRENTLIDKMGVTEGFAAYIGVLPARQSGIVVLANKRIPHSAVIQLARAVLFHAAAAATAGDKTP